MRTSFKWLSVLLSIVVLVLAGCSGPEEQPAPTSMPAAEVESPPAAEVESPPAAVPEPTWTPEPTTAPEPTAVAETSVDPAAEVVLTMVERVNAEDYAGAAELVSDDMMAYLVGMPPTGMEIYWGKEQFRTFLEECCTGQHFEWQVTPERVDNGVVYAEAKTWMDFTRELGVAPNTFRELFVVEDEKISLYVSTMTEEALANFKPALREVMPALFEAPLPSDERPASEVTISITDGTCAYDGPMTLQAGELRVNADVQDETWEKYAVTFFTLDEGKDLIDLMATTYQDGPPAWSEIVFLEELAPHESQTYTHPQVEEGLLYMVCWAGSPDVPIGNAGPFVVTP